MRKVPTCLEGSVPSDSFEVFSSWRLCQLSLSLFSEKLLVFPEAPTHLGPQQGRQRKGRVCRGCAGVGNPAQGRVIHLGATSLKGRACEILERHRRQSGPAGGVLLMQREMWTGTHGVPLGRVVPALLSGGVEEGNLGGKGVAKVGIY